MKKKGSTAAQEAPAVEFRQPPQSSPTPPLVSQITQPYADLWRVDFVVLGVPVPQPRASHGRGGAEILPHQNRGASSSDPVIVPRCGKIYAFRLAIFRTIADAGSCNGL